MKYVLAASCLIWTILAPISLKAESLDALHTRLMGELSGLNSGHPSGSNGLYLGSLSRHTQPEINIFVDARPKIEHRSNVEYDYFLKQLHNAHASETFGQDFPYNRSLAEQIFIDSSGGEK